MGLMYLKSLGAWFGDGEKRVDVLIENQCRLNEKVHQHETFGAKFIWHDFHSVANEET